MSRRVPAVWFPTVRTGTGTDVFTEGLVEELRKRGLQAVITWLPLRAEYAPWTVPVPQPPSWATVTHVNTWLHSRFIPRTLPVVATVHHSIHDPALSPYKDRLRSLYHQCWIRPVERRTMHRADIVTTVSQFVADMAREQVLDRKMRVVYNGVDTDKFRPPEIHGPHKPFRLLYVGSWMARKGVDLLAPIMRELGDEFELRYTGGTGANVGGGCGMPGNMRDIGRIHGAHAVRAAMHEADALLFPSRSEGHPLAVLEAMACGLPVIAVQGSSLPEVVENGATGCLCAQDDVAAFTVAARKLAISDLRKLSCAARASVVESFSINKMTEAYMDVYDALTLS